MRIVHFTDTYLPRRDGVITSVRTLVAAQRSAGWVPLTVVPRHPGQPVEPDVHRLRAVPLGLADLRVSPWLLRAAAADGTLRRVADHEPDVIHVHTPGPVGLLGVLAARRLGLPLVQTYHTDLHAYAEAYRFPVRALRAGVRLYAHRLDVPRPAMRPPTVQHRHTLSQRRVVGYRHAAMDACNRLLLSDAEAVVVPTPAVLQRITLPVPDERIFVVPTGVAARATTLAEVAALRDQHGLAAGDRVVLFVGRVNREKGVELLISAFERVLAAHSDAVLMLVGAVYESRWLAGLLRGVGPAADRVVLVGQQPPETVAAAYGGAEIFAFPSLTDTQALVLQEAALAGLPCVLADPQLHRHGPLGQRGVLAGPDPASFAAAISGLLDDPVRAGRVGAASAEWAGRHTPADYRDAISEVYRFACARAGRFNIRGRTRR